MKKLTKFVLLFTFSNVICMRARTRVCIYFKRNIRLNYLPKRYVLLKLINTIFESKYTLIQAEKCKLYVHTYSQ